MTVYRTCFGCAHQGTACEHRVALAAAIKGLGLTSVRHACKHRKSRFAIGDPVWLETVYDKNGDSDENGIPQDQFPGHVVREYGAKVLVYIKPGSPPRESDSDELNFVGSGFCRVSMTRLERRDGPREEVCKSCDMPASLGHLEGYICHRQAALAKDSTNA